MDLDAQALADTTAGRAADLLSGVRATSFTLAGRGASTVREALDEPATPQQVVEAPEAEAPLEADPSSHGEAREAAEKGETGAEDDAGESRKT